MSESLRRRDQFFLSGTRSVRRVLAVARQTLGATARSGVWWLLIALAGLLVAAAHWLRQFRFGPAEIGFVADTGLGVIGLVGTLLAIIQTAHVVLNDAWSGTMACVLARPVRRGEYLAGILVGTSAALALFTGFLGVVVAAVMTWRGHQLGVPGVAGGLFLQACAVQWMKFTVVAALALVISAMTNSLLFALGATMLAVVIGHLRPFANGELEWLRIWPNLGRFDGAALYQERSMGDGSVLRSLVGYWVLVCAWLTASATYVLGDREF